MTFSGRFSGRNGWHTDTTATPDAPNYDEYGRVIADPTTRSPAFDTDLTATGLFKVSDKGLYKGYLEDLIELYEDCDIDC